MRGWSKGLFNYSPSTRKFELVNIEGDLGERGIGKFPASKYRDSFGVYWIWNLFSDELGKIWPLLVAYFFLPLGKDLEF